MNKEKQIEEMAKDICKGCQTRLTPTMKCNRNCCAMAEVVAENLYNIGYRKDYITEKRAREIGKEMFGQVRKETAKEFGNFILTLFPSDKNFTTISRATIKAKLKEYGVEIEE